MDNELAARWQKQVEGVWHGCPGIFDAEGLPQGHVQADRSIFVDDQGQHLIQVDTRVHCTGRLRQRLETPVHRLHVKHHENKRVYEGPDFFGAGYPYGSLILGNDYCLPWRTDNRVHVQLLPGGQLQAYSNVALQGQSVVGVITGLYRLSRDYADNPDTRRAIDIHRAEEVEHSLDVHLLPRRERGTFEGELETYGADQQLQGTTHVAWQHTPQGQYRVEQALSWSGVVNRECRMERSRHENQHFFEEGFWGNATGFGRALFWRGHFRGEARRLVGRDFLLPGGDLAVVWELWHADTLEHVMHGVLHWRPAR